VRLPVNALYICALTLLLSLLGEAAVARHEYSGDAMGTAFRIVVYSSDARLGEAAAASALNEARRLDRMLSNYLGDSEWSHINRQAAETPVPVTREMFELLQDCLEYSRESEGAFDITVGPLMKLWGFYKDSGHVPHPYDLKTVLANVGYRNIELDRRKQTVRFLKTGVQMDPGGIGKGYAVERMVSIVKAAGVSAALISAGGSTIYALGAPPGADGWLIHITNPRHPSRDAAQLILKDASLSTSGTTEKFFRADGIIYSHIMDPRTGYPARGVLSVNVVAPRAVDSEAWTKPFFIQGRHWTEAHMPAGFEVFMCEDSGAMACGWLPERRGVVHRQFFGGRVGRMALTATARHNKNTLRR
jgi:thiamine biosynthesis lipoprotein